MITLRTRSKEFQKIFKSLIQLSRDFKFSDHVKCGDLETAIQMIGMLIKVLGQIKTTFENLKDFWIMQEMQCNQLQNLWSYFILLNIVHNEYNSSEKNEGSLGNLIENDKNKAARIRLKSSVQKSVLNWASLFKVNHDAFLAIEE